MLSGNAIYMTEMKTDLAKWYSKNRASLVLV